MDQIEEEGAMVNTNQSNAFSNKKEKCQYGFLRLFPVTGRVSRLEFVECKWIFGLDWEYDTRESNMGYNSLSTFGWIKLGTRKVLHSFGSCISQSCPCLTLWYDTAPLLKYTEAFWEVSFYGHYHFTQVLRMLAYSSFLLESLCLMR